MNIVHLSAECYPIAKVGGLADVVGTLPKYQNVLGEQSHVIMPFYDIPFTQENSFNIIYNGTIKLGFESLKFNVKALKKKTLDFDLFLIDVPEILFESYIYSNDDTDRFLAFQIAALDFLVQRKERPDIVHCHDHHTGLVPFMMSHSKKYEALRKIPTVLTIHNAQYQGWFSHDKVHMIPEFNFSKVGLLDWDHAINPLACAIKCAWRVTTVSPNYMEEMHSLANGLESLIRAESAKCSGILNGIDSKVWDPKSDSFILKNYSARNIQSGKKANKAWLCQEYNLDPELPLFVFIGRLVGEKGADLFPAVFDLILKNMEISILLLGSGHQEIENELVLLKSKYEGSYNAIIGYDESLSHRMYAGADFLLMPSRVEPCGLNQMYSLRYGTIPVVSKVGGLKDTVIDIEDDGYGICFEKSTVEEIYTAVLRADVFYKDVKSFRRIRQKIMSIDYSWDSSAQQYINLYKSIK